MVKNNKSTPNSKSNMGMILVIAGVVFLLLFGMKGSGTGGGGGGGGGGTIDGGGGNGGIGGGENVKIVTCKVTVFNPRLNDDFEIKSATCDSQVFDKCSGSPALSVARPLVIFDRDDVEVKLSIGSSTQTETISLADSEITGSRTETITFKPVCVKLSTNQGMVEIFDPRNGQQTNEKEVSF